MVPHLIPLSEFVSTTTLLGPVPETLRPVLFDAVQLPDTCPPVRPAAAPPVAEPPRPPPPALLPPVQVPPRPPAPGPLVPPAAVPPVAEPPRPPPLAVPRAAASPATR